MKIKWDNMKHYLLYDPGIHLLIYCLSGYFRRGVTFAIFSQTVRVVSNFAKIEKKQN
jgi:hypothetical protein